MNKVLAIVFSVVIVASLAVAGVMFLREPEAAIPEKVTDLTVVAAPEQTQAERPPVFPDPYANWIKLPETSNLAKGKAVTSGAVTEIYVSRNVTDGSLTSYWESKGLPAELVIDLGEARAIRTVVVRLNPAPIWEPRTQVFEILVSDGKAAGTEDGNAEGTEGAAMATENATIGTDNAAAAAGTTPAVDAASATFVSVVANARYEFNSNTGNMVRVDFAPTTARFVKLIFTEKSSGRSNGGQAAEVEIYE